jgi:hypothetical protein
MFAVKTIYFILKFVIISVLSFFIAPIIIAFLKPKADNKDVNNKYFNRLFIDD